MESLSEIHQEYHDAGIRLCRAVRAKYGMGAIVQAKTAHGYLITAEVVGHGASWHQPNYVRVRNTHTGGVHSIPFGNIVETPDNGSLTHYGNHDE